MKLLKKGKAGGTEAGQVTVQGRGFRAERNKRWVTGLTAVGDETGRNGGQTSNQKHSLHVSSPALLKVRRERSKTAPDVCGLTPSWSRAPEGPGKLGCDPFLKGHLGGGGGGQKLPFKGNKEASI